MQGNNLLKSKDYLHAIEAFTKAIEINPNNSQCINARARCLLACGQHQRALEDADRVIELKHGSIARQTTGAVAAGLL